MPYDQATRRFEAVLLSMTMRVSTTRATSKLKNKRWLPKREKAMRNMFLVGDANKMFECGMIL